jgi:hypothetical protein
MAIRKIVVPTGKPAATKKAAAAPEAPKMEPNADKAVAKAKPAPAPAITIPPKRERAPKAPRAEHGVTSQYAGPSLGLNKRKSTTALDLSQFGSDPDYVLTLRTEQVGRALKAKYGNKPFERANADAGILKYLGRKGYIEHVSGDPSSETCQFRFTTAGMRL